LRVSEKLAAGDLERVQNWLDRLASQWVACADFELDKPKQPQVLHKRFYFDTNFGYGIYIRHGTRQLYHNVGADIGFSFQFKENFDFFVRVSISGAAKDPDQDLLVSFESFRAMVGPGFTVLPRPKGAHLHPSRARVRLHRQLRGEHRPQLQFFGEESTPCNQGEHLAAAHALRHGPTWLWASRWSWSTTLYSTCSSTSQGSSSRWRPRPILNFPLFAHVGLGYKF